MAGLLRAFVARSGFRSGALWSQRCVRAAASFTAPLGWPLGKAAGGTGGESDHVLAVLVLVEKVWATASVTRRGLRFGAGNKTSSTRQVLTGINKRKIERPGETERYLLPALFAEVATENLRIP